LAHDRSHSTTLIINGLCEAVLRIVNKLAAPWRAVAIGSSFDKTICGASRVQRPRTSRTPHQTVETEQNITVLCFFREEQSFGRSERASSSKLVS
jgi:hypothetical protein